MTPILISSCAAAGAAESREAARKRTEASARAKGDLRREGCDAGRADLVPHRAGAVNAEPAATGDAPSGLAPRERPHRDPLRFQPGADRAGEPLGAGRIAVDADRLG